MQDNRENTKYKTAPLRVKGRLDPFGIHQLRYGKSNIKEFFGEIIATLKREF